MRKTGIVAQALLSFLGPCRTDSAGMHLTVLSHFYLSCSHSSSGKPPRAATVPSKRVCTTGRHRLTRKVPRSDRHRESCLSQSPIMVISITKFNSRAWQRPRLWSK